MEIESIKSVGAANSGAASSYVPPVSDTSGNSVKVVNDTQKAAATPSESNSDSNNQSEVQNQANENRKVAKSTIDSTISETNSKIKYHIDEETQRISIKIIDKDTDKVIREVPPEETLEAIKKIWEIAGIIVDEKR
jgi:flagellar protein FlaG